MTDRILVRRVPWQGPTWWQVLCPCCADRKPGVAVLAAFGTWRRAADFARAHAWIHR